MDYCSASGIVYFFFDIIGGFQMCHKDLFLYQNQMCHQMCKLLRWNFYTVSPDNLVRTYSRGLNLGLSTTEQNATISTV